MSGLRVSASRLGVAFAGAVGVLLCSLVFVGFADAALPDGRAFELVSQANTNGAPSTDPVGTTNQLINDDTFWFGDSVTPVESSPSGVELMYAGSRGENGWSDTSLDMSGLGPYLEERFEDATRADVGGDGAPLASIWATANPQIFEKVPQSEVPIGLYYRNSEGIYSLIVSEPAAEGSAAVRFLYGGMSADGQTVVYQPTGEPGAVSRVVAWQPGGATRRLSTGVLSECGADTITGTDEYNTEALPTNSVSEDGSTVFMESPEGGAAPCPSHPQVYVNDEGSVSLISTPSDGSPLPEGAPPAWFVGATPNGRTAYFLSRGDLTAESPTQEELGYYSTELYQWSAGQGLSCVTCKAGATVGIYPGGVAVSSNGRDVWIVSSGQASRPSTLYLYSDGRLQAAPGPEAYSEVVIGPGSFAISPSGEEVAISLHVSNGPPEVTQALYRVSDSTGSLEESCISCVDGVPYEAKLGLSSSGDLYGVPGASTVGGALEGPLTSDGETIVFTSAAALAPGAEPGSTGLADVYEWNQERGISLIAEDDTFGAEISPDGSNIFFTSLQDLTPNATQSNEMLYDARVGGGFPEKAAPAKSTCAVESTCQASGGAVALPTVGATPSAGNLPSAGSGAKAGLGSIALSRAERASLERTGSATVRLRSDGAGTVTLAATCRLAGRAVGCAHAVARSKAGAQTLVLTLRLSRAARDALARSGRLPLSLTATLAGASARHASYLLARRAPKHRRRPTAKRSAKPTVHASEVQR